MSPIGILNATIAFFCELAMLALLAIGGYNTLKTPQVARWALAILIPLIVIAVWGYFIAPKSEHRLDQPLLCIVQLVLFSLAALLAYRFVSHWLILVFVSLAFGSSILAVYLKQ